VAAVNVGFRVGWAIDRAKNLMGRRFLLYRPRAKPSSRAATGSLSALPPRPSRDFSRFSDDVIGDKETTELGPEPLVVTG
jgi:hypothetical protein